MRDSEPVALPEARDVLRAWNEGLGWRLPRRPSRTGFHDEALFRTVNPPDHWAFSRLRFLVTVDHVLSLPGKRVLDVAAGPCFMAMALRFAGREVSVADIRPGDDALDIWEVGREVGRHWGDIFDLDPAEVGEFDVVLCAELIEHVAHPDRLLGHLRRFLRPNGRLVITTPNGRFLGSGLPTYSIVGDRRALEARQFQPDADGHLFLFTPAELRDLMERAGYDVVASRAFGSPATTGALRARHIAGLVPPRILWSLERSVQAFPPGIRDRLLAHQIVSARVRSRRTA